MGVKDKIIKESLELFSSKGFEKTSVSDIIKATGSSRGGFYHHYSSKEEILDEIIELYMADFSKPFDSFVKNHEGSQIDLFMKLFNAIIDFKIGQIPEWSVLNKLFSFKGNHLIIYRISTRFEKIVTEIYTSLIKKGNDCGEFSAQYPAPLAALWTREVLLLIREMQKAHLNAEISLNNQLVDQILFVEGVIARELSVNSKSLNLRQKLSEYLVKMGQEE